MRFSFLVSFSLALVAGQAGFAQPMQPDVPNAQTKPTERIALSTPANPAAAPGTVLTCSLLTGQVLDENGHPLVGATVMLAGTSYINSTNAEGYFSLTRPLKPWQRLRVSSAGYADLELRVEQCNTPPITLRPLPGTRIKQGKRHYGKILKVGTAE
jgi:hypothetical protein